MGKKLEIQLDTEGDIALLYIIPQELYIADIDHSGSPLFAILRKAIWNEDLTEVIKETDEIAGFEIIGISEILSSQIPNIQEKFDVINTSLKDVSIREVVAFIQKHLKKTDQNGRQVA